MSTISVMREKPLPGTIKAAQKLIIGASDFSPGCAVIDFVFPNIPPFNLKKITFQNFYTASISIKLKMPWTNSDGDKHTTWVTCLRDMKLMENPHVETGGEKLVTIMADDLRHAPIEVSAVRFILRQPSPCWHTFAIESIAVYSHDSATSANVLPQWLLTGEDDLYIGLSGYELPPKTQAKRAGLPDMEQLSEKLHALWSVAMETKAAQPDATLGRFDIDGCYEINLLSYSNN